MYKTGTASCFRGLASYITNWGIGDKKKKASPLIGLLGTKLKINDILVISFLCIVHYIHRNYVETKCPNAVLLKKEHSDPSFLLALGKAYLDSLPLVKL